MNTVSASSFSAPRALSASDRLKAVAAALGLGVTLLFLVGFAPVTNLHNAAHDTRHGLAFPCH